MRTHAYHPRRVLVKFSAGTEGDRRGHALSRIASIGEAPLGSGASEEMSRWRMVDLSESMRVDAALQGLALEGAVVECAEPDWEVTALRAPNDPRFSYEWALNNTGQINGVVDADIDAPEAWDLATGTDVVVGVIDSGVDWAHPDLAANLWTNVAELSGAPGVDDDGNGYVDDVRGYDFRNNDNDPTDDNGHGTHVAGTIGAVGNNGVGVAGVCWSARLMPLKFMDASLSGYGGDAIRAIRYATRSGARLTSNSWGGGGYSQAEADAIQEASASGVLFVAAAGNSATNNDTSPIYPASYTLSNIIAVAATDSSDRLATFSCYGSASVDLGAPGVSIMSTWPGGSYATMNGTSMAAPHVAGACALLWSHRPSSGHLQVRDAVLSGADPVSGLSGKCVTGGRLNACRSLQALGGTAPTTHAISGTVSLGGGPLSGVTVTLSGGTTTTTDSAGAFAFGALADGAYTVTPTRSGYVFSPTSRNVALSGADSGGNDFAGAVLGERRPIVGLGRGAGGLIDVLGTRSQAYAHQAYVAVPWSEYAASNGETRVAVGDMDGDGRDEMLVGIGPNPSSGGWGMVLDDAQAGYALRRWIRLSSGPYDAANGETWPAVGDVDGDGRAEMVLGTGPSSGLGGFAEVFDDLLAPSASPIAQVATGRSTYNRTCGEVRPSCGDVDGDGRAEVVLGYGTYPSDGGWVDVFDDAAGRFRRIARIRVQWGAYNSSNGATQPSCGDTDGNGQADIVVGLGTGGAGRFEVFRGASGRYAHRGWGTVPWTAYASYDGQTRIACGDLDGNGRAETVVGLGAYPGNGGWLYVFGDDAAGYACVAQARAGWATYDDAGGETRPAVMR